MVAGLLLTRTTFIPSSRRERHAWLPEKSNSAPCPIIIGPEPIRSTFLISDLFGIFQPKCHDLLLILSMKQAVQELFYQYCRVRIFFRCTEMFAISLNHKETIPQSLQNGLYY